MFDNFIQKKVDIAEIEKLQSGEEHKTCGNCAWHIHDESGFIDKFCKNSKSEYDDFYTEDSATCDDWEGELDYEKNKN